MSPLKKIRITEPPSPPERGVKAATFRLLIDTAMEIIRERGHIPSVAEVAVKSKVSRATAYRYFPTRASLVTAVIEYSLAPIRRPSSDEPDARRRVHDVFAQTFPRFREFEPQFRAAAQLALEQWALERAGLLEEEPYRRGHRVHILQHALEPLARELSTATRDRLHKALSVIYGIESYIVLKDIWRVSEREVLQIAQWIADALIDKAIRDDAPAERTGSSIPGPRQRRSNVARTTRR